MHVRETAVPGAYVLTSDHHSDRRGGFFEVMRADVLEAVLGRPFVPRQINCSTSRRNTLRGIRGVTVPPGQAKYVTCVSGAVRDIVVDLRVGSPAFGHHAVNELYAGSGRSVYIPEGAGHAFLALTDDTCVCYALSSTHAPEAQISINPLDPDLALPWGTTEPPLLSDGDAAAPSMAETVSAGLLPRWREPGDPSTRLRGSNR
ncbi:NDP-hexose 3,5-(Or5-) epimerase [Actinomadura luteofluorescens]|uniref:NDP-hexose 3,5-(Or5-) epimerase n=1 Tax=Actinomadura luteofluorescens TaxID=46163 RepID=A0A7Y9ER98_9ACTN|nr:dTDP-4-dehydrorhamnose 3,5-epimerase family protein [Actinomadura luteofluorescens]NYD52500.1 NDP-hexose 3,5-(Or5-) epimerase [Actinomadura luteofluorescens]